MSWIANTLKPVGLSWFGDFLTSSIGRKFVMSLSGLFLILFLPVHLLGNLQLLKQDGGEAFNLYTYFMTHNPLIKTVSYVLYFSILLHTIQGILLYRQNRKARGNQKYAVQVVRATNTNAKAAANMAWLGIIIFVFIVIHMYQFWLQMKLDYVPYVTIAGEEYKNLYTPVVEAFANPLYVIIYVISMVVIAFHLNHGFQSSFQTLGINHHRYTPFIQGLGRFYSVIIPLGFAIIPIFVFGRVQGWW
ncbi:MAG: succinate dehydrogenase cytochrome b subunit [Lewinellaceae bacterium]|nr:succinate dehydrogenase cytochrome b subunit [Lewinellaceae bacterium]